MVYRRSILSSIAGAVGLIFLSLIPGQIDGQWTPAQELSNKGRIILDQNMSGLIPGSGSV